MLKSFVAFILYYLFIISIVFAEIQKIGVPYIENYAKAVYQAGNQNWGITKDERNIMYYGNSEGLLSFDGRSWQLHRLPNKLIVRSVAADKKGKIFTGAFGELGYWTYNDKAILKYQSLTHLIPKNFKLNDEIWKIYIDGNRILFQSFAAILIYEAGKIEVVRSANPYLFLLQSGKRFFVEELKKGLHELNGKQLNYVTGSEILNGSAILSVLPFGNGLSLIGTSKSGLFLYDGNKIIPWKVQASDFLKVAQLNNGVKISEQYYAFGTILDGVVVIDKAGNIVQHINKSSGLQNNTVLSLFLDDAQNLWAGLDNGIDRIELNSPLSFYFDKAGVFGTVYSSIIYGGKIYLGTNQGLFYSNWDASGKMQKFNFQLIPNSQGQVWELAVINGELYCGHNSGTFIVSGANITRISAVNGGWTLKKMPLLADKLIQGTYTGLVIYNQTPANTYQFSHKIDGFGEPSRYVEQDIKGNIWVSQAYKGVFKINLSGDLKRVTKLKNYSEKDGLPSSYGINIFNLDGRIIFSSEKGFYVYDEITDKFKRYQELNQNLGSYAKSNKVIKASDNLYWFIDHGRVALVNFKDAGEVKIDSNKFSVLDGRMVQDYENISKINSNLYLISVDDGFVLYNQESKEQQPKIPSVVIGKITNITGSNFLITGSGSLSKNIEISAAESSIRINYALPYYRQANIQYQYYLEGFSDDWSEWSSQSQKDFTNLSFGTYRFKVRAKINETIITPETVFEFEVLPPFYVTKTALFVYLILLIMAVYLVRKWYFRKLIKHQEHIKQQLQQEKEEHLKREALANEQRMIKLKNEKLQAELESKSREVTNSAMNIVYKNELLQKIKHELSNLKDDTGKRLSEEQLRKIQKVIDDGMSDERDWNLFETSFNETHENFFKKLKHNHPDLVPNDLKLCAYLRLNMSSKEMASLLNISVRGVEIRRYRLRKKLNIPHDKNLVEFLIEL
ncbi:triple tyrosine motif-containing protein [Pedobacter glucosidilyticus]|uniref:triple tyrosine motif-containing protein n=1 Tax=Pedobacter glucosidilyticus TaxID=1122941 RepID=UPI0026EA76D3|nr:triple tyrosine motif-containing protein [Pedobacter glucosidilyticus]